MANLREVIDANGTPVNAFRNDKINSDFISLTDIAKYRNQEEPNDIIKNWLRTRNTLEYLGLWEQMYNPQFNNEYFNELLSKSGSNAFVISPTKWIKGTNAIGMVSQPGRYGGTYAEADIAFEFASWVSPEFRLYLVKDYQQLKKDESSHLNLDWSVNRALSKVNYRLHTDAIKESIVPLQLTRQQAGMHYANEADMLNVVLFGMTAREWKKAHPNSKGNIRDNASLEQLTVLANLESLNAELIKEDIPINKRARKLNKVAREQLTTLLKNQNSLSALKKLKKPKNNNLLE